MVTDGVSIRNSSGKVFFLKKKEKKGRVNKLDYFIVSAKCHEAFDYIKQRTILVHVNSMNNIII